MQYKKRVSKRIALVPTVQTVKATDVLHENMMFWKKEGPELIRSVYMLLFNTKTDTRNERTKISQLYESIPDKLIKIADTLAQYQSPKLQRIEATEKVEHKFVIEAPRLAYSTDEWLNGINSDKMLQIAPPEKKH